MGKARKIRKQSTRKPLNVKRSEVATTIVAAESQPASSILSTRSFFQGSEKIMTQMRTQAQAVVSAATSAATTAAETAGTVATRVSAATLATQEMLRASTTPEGVLAAAAATVMFCLGGSVATMQGGVSTVSDLGGVDPVSGLPYTMLCYT